MNELIFPALCPACKSRRIYNLPLCKTCQAKLLPLPKALLQKIQEEVQADEDNPVYVGFLFNSVIQDLLHNLKYRNMKSLGRFLGRKLAELLIKNKLNSFDFIIPVPIHKKRIQERGYNQSFLIAQGIKELIDAPIYENIIYRRKYTSSQTKLNKAERIENVKDKFVLQNENIISNKNILLVDDVITTGATINECAKVLNKSNPGLILKTAVATPLF